MGVALGDVDNDGLLDVYVTHLSQERNTLWKQGPRGQFRDWTRLAQLASVEEQATGFGTVMADFNLDGALDIAVVNGRVQAGSSPDTGLGFWQPYAERNQLFASAVALAGSIGFQCQQWTDSGKVNIWRGQIGGRQSALRQVFLRKIDAAHGHIFFDVANDIRQLKRQPATLSERLSRRIAISENLNAN